MNIEALSSQYWERKAKEARGKAKTMTSAEARRLMRDVARRYRQMAAIASKRGTVRRTRTATSARSSAAPLSG
jgi:hypothetical protein